MPLLFLWTWPLGFHLFVNCVTNKYFNDVQSTSENRTVRLYPIQFYASPGHSNIRPFENRTSRSGFRMVTSLDRFIKKRVIKNILFLTKRSRLVIKYPVRISTG
jgi:hypothetical protein